MAHIETSLIAARMQEAVPRQLFAKSRFCSLANFEGRESGGASPGVYLAPKSRQRKLVYLSKEPFAFAMYFSAVLLNSREAAVILCLDCRLRTRARPCMNSSAYHFTNGRLNVGVILYSSHKVG
jgi:hypothetical protein